MFGWFERRIDAFPLEKVGTPPPSLVAFCRYYTRGCWRWLALMACFTTMIALMEVSLFGFLGNIVDWLSSQPRATFFAAHGLKLTLMGAMVLVLLPLAVGIHSLLIH